MATWVDLNTIGTGSDMLADSIPDLIEDNGGSYPLCQEDAQGSISFISLSFNILSAD